MPILNPMGRPVTIDGLGNAQMLDILKGKECWCGEWKKPMMSHCRRCYFALPPEMRQALYRRFGQGYEEAFRASLRALAE